MWICFALVEDQVTYDSSEIKASPRRNEAMESKKFIQKKKKKKTSRKYSNTPESGKALQKQRPVAR